MLLSVAVGCSRCVASDIISCSMAFSVICIPFTACLSLASNLHQIACGVLLSPSQHCVLELDIDRGAIYVLSPVRVVKNLHSGTSSSFGCTKVFEKFLFCMKCIVLTNHPGMTT